MRKACINFLLYFGKLAGELRRSSLTEEDHTDEELEAMGSSNYAALEVLPCRDSLVLKIAMASALLPLACRYAQAKVSRIASPAELVGARKPEERPLSLVAATDRDWRETGSP